MNTTSRFGDNKHIVRTDSRLCGCDASTLFGSVVFRSPEELDALIQGLMALRAGWDDASAHIHLQDYGMAPGGDPTQLEVIFSSPTWADSESEAELRAGLVADARRVLSQSHRRPIDVELVLNQLIRGPAFVRQLIYEMPPELRKRRPAPGIWSAHEHAVHLPAVHPIMLARLEQMLRDPTLSIRSYEPSRDQQDGALLGLDLEAEMNRFQCERSAIVKRLRELSPEQWAVSASHEEYSHYSIFIMFRHLALHDLYHAYRIEERLLRKVWD